MGAQTLQRKSVIGVCLGRAGCEVVSVCWELEVAGGRGCGVGEVWYLLVGKGWRWCSWDESTAGVVLIVVERDI
jgi:hypothetical protein